MITTTNLRGKVLRFGGLEAIYYAVLASFGAYALPLGLARGYAKTDMSLMMSAYMVLAFLGQFFWGSVCDTLRTNKKVFLIGILLTELTQLMMYFSGSELVYAIFYGIYGFTMGPTISILDTWMIKSVSGDMKAYSMARGGGSISYALSTLLMGQLIQRFGYFLMPLCSTVLIVVTLVVGITTPDAEFGHSSSARKISAQDAFSILRVPAYVALLAMMFFLGMANSPISYMKIMVLESVGGNVGTQGIDSFFGSAAQFLIFEFGFVLARIPAKTRLWMCALCMTGALALDVTAETSQLIIAGTVLSSCAYALLMPAGREIAMKLIDGRFQTTANGLMDACYSFLAGMISLLYSGALAQAVNVKFMIMVAFLFSLVPLCILVGLELAGRKKHHTKKEKIL